MNNSSIEVAVGIFVITSLICVGYLSIKLGKIGLLGKNYSVITAQFDSVSGLRTGSSVDISGVEIGRVESIDFDNTNQVAIVKMKILKKIFINEDSIASIRTSGLIGNKYIQLTLGASDKYLESGGHIFETESAVDIEELLSKYLFGTTQ